MTPPTGMASEAGLSPETLHLIWRQEIWNIEHASDSLRPMADRRSMTQNHFDHVHVSTYPKP